MNLGGGRVGRQLRPGEPTHVPFGVSALWAIRWLGGLRPRSRGRSPMTHTGGVRTAKEEHQ